MDDTEHKIVLVIERDAAQARIISAVATREGWRSLVVGNGKAALDSLRADAGAPVSAIILDQRIAGEATPDLLADLRKLRPALPIVVLTASTSPMLAVEAMRAGASDYIVKPITPDRLTQALRNARMRSAPREELMPLAEKMGGALDFDAMVGTSPPFRDVLAKAAKAARGHGSVLIEGEAGTGKDMLVRAIQAASPRAKGPFRMLNISAIPASSLESALFGHEKGAFAGAFESMTGALEQCDGGTLALDEVDRLSPSLQDKLAEFLADGRLRPIGSSYSYRIDVRLLSASDLPLVDLAASGQFRPELLERLSATRIVMPPLRERNGDITALARHFLAQMGEQPGLRPLGITDDALELLSIYDWPGNVRQLQAVLFRAAVFCEGNALTAEDFPQLADAMAGTAFDKRPRNAGGIEVYTADNHIRPLEEIEADVIRLAIGHYRGRMSEVARRLGIGRSTLYRKLDDIGIERSA